MDKLIKEQLSKVKVAVLPPYDENVTEIFIPKTTQILSKNVLEGNYYLVQLAPFILNEPEGYNLSSNWNNGSVPLHSCYKCEVNKILGKMIKITGIGYDLNNQIDLNYMWSGWVPQEGVTILQKL